jgi:hypothetical protein
MSTLTKWNPFRDLEDIQNRLSPWFGRIALRGGGDETMTTSAWAPLVDITEDDKEYLINGLRSDLFTLRQMHFQHTIFIVRTYFGAICTSRTTFTISPCSR